MTDTSKSKPCSDCRWGRIIVGERVCNEPRVVSEKPARLYTRIPQVRQNPGMCGPDAAWFKAIKKTFKPYKVQKSSYPKASGDPDVWLVKAHKGQGLYTVISRQPSLERAMAAVERHAARQP